MSLARAEALNMTLFRQPQVGPIQEQRIANRLGPEKTTLAGGYEQPRSKQCRRRDGQLYKGFKERESGHHDLTVCWVISKGI
jgi:hypothetical protein